MKEIFCVGNMVDTGGEKWKGVGGWGWGVDEGWVKLLRVTGM